MIKYDIINKYPIIEKIFTCGRLIDVFLLGPIQILIGLYIKTNAFLKFFMIILGISNILYNGHNYLHFCQGTEIHPYIKHFIHPKYGKTQIHRLYNIFIMYPILAYVYMTEKLPKFLEYILLFDIIFGFTINFLNIFRFM